MDPGSSGHAVGPSVNVGNAATTQCSPLTRFHLYNVRGLHTKTHNKVPLVSDIVHDPSQPAALIALTETWLHDHLDAEIAISQFQPPFRQDRSRKKKEKGRGSGGVAVYVREGIAAETSFSYSSGVIECIGVMVESLNLMTYTVYRQPDEPNHRSTNQQFTPFINKLNSHIKSLPTPTPDIILQGDFNLPHANWETGECRSKSPTDKVSKPEKLMVKALYELSLEHFLVQQVEGPTQKSGNTLDLIFTNNAPLVHNLETLPLNNRMSDHHQIVLDVSYKHDEMEDGNLDDSQTASDNEEGVPTNAARWRKLNFLSPDIKWETVSSDIEAHDWHSEFRNKDVLQMHDAFLDVCLDISERHIPLRKPRKARDHIPKHNIVGT